MKKFIFLFLITFILSGFSLVAQTSTLPENGDGSKSSPYEIATLDNLYWLSQTSTAWNNHFVQTADIDAFDTQN
ncbi:MAG TPA: membrane lipoprotein lipid attachment site-containing protein, partial [Edaphocola sp.]|nr:membrane lipoprotein lipid attachment site-containing protein [Edaphocola sp.]